MTRRSAPLQLVVLLCFLASGAAGLIYQIAWTRYLALFLGHTGYAVVAILISFMGGLAIGNAGFGRLADRCRRPLELYAWLEIGIGLYGVVFPAYDAFCHGRYVALARAMGAGSGTLLGLKFAFGILTVCLPAVLMGATFPALTRFVTQRLGELRQRVAVLYAINSAGAVAGCLAADFWLLPVLGLEATVWSAAVLNFLAGLVAFVVSRRLDLDAPAESPVAAAASDERYTPAELRLALVGAAVSGFAAMLYEVAWTRLLALTLGSSTHAYSLMLAAFITGLTLGAAWVSRPRRMSSLRLFAWAELALAGVLFLSLFGYDLLPLLFVKLAWFLRRRVEAYPVFAGLQMGICFLVVLVPTFFLGMTLPLASRAATAELARTGRSVGRVFAVNTLGTVLGAAVTGLWLMPALGLARTFGLGVALSAGLGAVILAWNRPAWRRPVLGLVPVAGAALVWFCGWQFNASWQALLSTGYWRRAEDPSLEHYRFIGHQARQIYYRDGAGSTVTVAESIKDGRQMRYLKVNGKTDASTGIDDPTQLLLGHLPLLLRPDSQRVLVVGLGSGMTAGAVAAHPGVTNLDVVEISPEVVEAAGYFAEYNRNVLADPRVRVAVEDAKSFLKIAPRPYDVIISEPSNPWMAGVAGVFSQEFYADCRSRLVPGGLMVQWIHLYESNDQVLNLVLRTFTSVFPHTSVWKSPVDDLLLVGAARPWAVDLGALETRLNLPLVKRDLAGIGLDRLPVLLTGEVLSPDNTRFVPPAETPVHSDYFPVLEYMAQKAFFLRWFADGWEALDERDWPRAGTLLGRYLLDHPLSREDLEALANAFVEHKAFPVRLMRSVVARWTAEDKSATPPLRLAGLVALDSDSADLVARKLSPAVKAMLGGAPLDLEVIRLYVLNRLFSYRQERSVFYVPPTEDLEAVLRALIEADPDNRRVYRLQLAELAWDRGDDNACMALAGAAFDPDTTRGGPLGFTLEPGAPHKVLTRMLEDLWRRGQAAAAAALCEQAVRNAYLGDAAKTRDPRLELTARKVLAAAEARPQPVVP